MNLKLILSLTTLLGFSGISFSQILTLEDAITTAQEKSPALKKSNLELKQSYFGLKSSKLAFWSTVDLNLTTPFISKNITEVIDTAGKSTFVEREYMSYSSELSINQPIVWTDGTLSLISSVTARQDKGFDKNYLGDLRLRLTQPLFTYNRRSVGLERSEIQLAMAEKNYIVNQQDIIYQVKSSYFDWFKAVQFQKIAESQLEQVKSSYELAKKKFDSGIIAEVQVLTLEVDYAGAQNDVYVKRTQTISAENRLKLLLGLNLEDKIEAPKEINLNTIKLNTDLILPEALKNRPEIENAQRQLRLQEISVMETDAFREFRMDLSLEVGLTKNEKDIAELTRNPNRAQQVSLNLTIPIWDWGRNSAQVSSQNAVYDARQIDVELSKKNLINEVNNLIESFLAAENRLRILEKTVMLAQKSYDISASKFRSGTVSSEELAQSQKRLTDAKINSITALLDYHLSIAALNRATLYDWEKQIPLYENLPSFED